jgi:hypothetical protein
VKDILTVFLDTFKDQVLARPYFYKSSRLVSKALIKIRPPPYTRGGGDLMDQQVELDRRMLDWIVGLDTEMNELVEGSHLYHPKVAKPSNSKTLRLSGLGLGFLLFLLRLFSFFGFLESFVGLDVELNELIGGRPLLESQGRKGSKPWFTADFWPCWACFSCFGATATCEIPSTSEATEKVVLRMMDDWAKLKHTLNLL